MVLHMNSSASILARSLPCGLLCETIATGVRRRSCRGPWYSGCAPEIVKSSVWIYVSTHESVMKSGRHDSLSTMEMPAYVILQVFLRKCRAMPLFMKWCSVRQRGQAEWRRLDPRFGRLVVFLMNTEVVDALLGDEHYQIMPLLSQLVGKRKLRQPKMKGFRGFVFLGLLARADC